MPTPDDLKAMDQSLSTLYDTLRNAYLAAPTPEVQNQIEESIDVVRRAIESLNEVDLANDNPDLTSLNAPLKAATKDLTDLKQKLEGIVQNVSAVAGAISAIDGVITAVGKVLPIVAGA
jgi:hypothetical protein